MGFYLSKPESLEFAVLPSNEVSGPIGLGDPDSTELSKVELDTMIPALMMDELRTKHLKDPEYFEEMKQRYLKMRANYRRTGLEQKIVRTEF